MILASYLLNVAILLPVCLGLLLRSPRMDRVFGADTTARQILTCMYLAILALSAYAVASENSSLLLARGLFGAQILYKMISLVLVRDRTTPVYWFNLGVALFHSVTLSTTINSGNASQ